MCRAQDTSGELGRSGQMVQIIVPTDTPGVKIVRGIGIWGHHTSDHCEVLYEDVRVPLDNALGRVGEGHRAAQDRLGAGRVFHCMNSIGQMWRAFDLMVERSRTRRSTAACCGTSSSSRASSPTATPTCSRPGS